MFDNVMALLPEIWLALWQTAIMVGISVGSALLFGMPLGVVLYLTDEGKPWQNRFLYRVINYVVNMVRSFPFVILLVSLIPLTRFLLGTTIGPVAASVPLSVAAIPYFARLVEQSLREVPKGVIEAAISMGASTPQIIRRVLLVEARSGLVLGITVVTISFLSNSAMAGLVGGGGIGDLAIRYGYYRFETDVMVAMVLILILLVQLFQFIGNRVARLIDKR